MGLKEYIRSNKEEYDTILDRMLNDRTFEEDTEILRRKMREGKYLSLDKDEIDLIVLSDYDKKSFFSELRRQIKPTAKEYMDKRLQGKSEQEVEQERKDELKAEVDSKKDPETILKEQTEGKNIDEKTREELRREILQAIYLNTAKEYYRLVKDLQTGVNGQIYTGAITNGKRMDDKVLAYQMYLRKIDNQHRAISHGRSVISENDDIKSLFNSEEFEKEKSEKVINKKREGDIEEVEKLNERISYLSRRIVEKTKELEYSGKKDAEELEALKKEYLDANAELANLRPNDQVLYEEQKEKEKYDEYKDRTGFTYYEEKVIKKEKDVDARVKRADDRNDASEEKQENSVKHEFEDEAIKENLERAEKALEEFDDAMYKGDYSRALDALVSAKTLVDPAASRADDIYEDARREIEEIKTQNLKSERNNRMGLGAISSQEEVTGKDVERKLNDERNSIDDKIKEARSKTDSIARER